MIKTTVDLTKPSLYAEPNSRWYRFKRKLTYKHMLDTCGKYISNHDDISILEVGTGSGFFVSFLEKAFPKVNIFGLEYDQRLVALTKLKVDKVSIVQGNAECFDFDRKFDLIISLQVIEHLYNPEQMLDSVSKNLTTNGVFIFTTPNLGCLSERILKEKWHGYREDHVSLKTRNEWDKLLTSMGYNKIYSGSTFFSGIPMLNKIPLGVLNWFLLYCVGSLPWSKGESYIGVFSKNN